MCPDTDPKRNHLLAALTDDEWARCLPSFECVSLSQGEWVYRAGAAHHHVIFPTTAVVSLMYVTREGASAELAIVGNEGLVGLPLLLGGLSTPSSGMVLSSGLAIRIEAPAIRSEFERAGSMTALLLRYTRAQIAQTAQTAACNRHHSIDQQLCRWLLICMDRVPGKELVMTQELIASMLGVRREGVTEAALKLQAAGLIHYARGHIVVLDRAGLEQRSCECYAMVKREYGRLLPQARETVSPGAHARAAAVAASPTRAVAARRHALSAH